MKKTVVSMACMVAMVVGGSGCVDDRTLFDDLLNGGGGNNDMDTDSFTEGGYDEGGQDTGTEEGSEDTDSSLGLPSLDMLRDNEGRIEVDRVADVSNVQFPTDMLTEDDYAAGSGDAVNVQFGSDLSLLSIDGEAGSWPVSDADANMLSYEFITPNHPAGGRLIVWIDDSSGEFQAEYTLYGSGVPIISSVRGPLIIIVV